MQGNYNNFIYPMYQQPPAMLPVNQPTVPGGNSAVYINIVNPSVYGSNQNTTNPYCQQGFYPMYGPNMNPNMMPYPQNYNNMIQTPSNERSLAGNNAMFDKTPSSANETSVKKEEKQDEDKKTQKTKKITPLTDDYVKSLENYLNNDNPKIRLIGAKELIERFKEDDNRKDNPSLMPLINKTLRDSNAAVRFLGLTALQLGYCVGNDETVQILKEIQAGAADKFGEDSLLASEILLKLAAPNQFEIPDNSPDEPKSDDKKEEKTDNVSETEQGSAQ